MEGNKRVTIIDYHDYRPVSAWHNKYKFVVVIYIQSAFVALYTHLETFIYCFSSTNDCMKYK